MSRSNLPQPTSDGRAGASARREHERRKASREKRIRGKHPLFGGLLLPADARMIAAEGETQRSSAYTIRRVPMSLER